MLINLWSVLVRYRQILHCDGMVTRDMAPVDSILEVERVQILVCLTVFLTSIKHSIAITSHEYILDVKVTAEMEGNDRLVAIEVVDRSRVAATIHATKFKAVVSRRSAQINLHILHFRTI